MNVTRAADWQSAVEKAVQTWGHVDVLVNNAGTSYENKVRCVANDETWLLMLPEYQSCH